MRNAQRPVLQPENWVKWDYIPSDWMLSMPPYFSAYINLLQGEQITVSTGFIDCPALSFRRANGK